MGKTKSFTKILIIENNSGFRLNLSHHFDNQKYRIFEACNQIDTEDILNSKKIDVALLCLNDLKNDGIAILKMIKEISPATKVITINTPEQIGLSIESMKVGAFHEFLIPFDIESLIKKVSQTSVKAKKE